jgi:glycosyltransferase involved in cell wall biosynthesis
VTSALPPFTVLMPVYRGDRPAFVRDAFRSTVTDQVLRPSEVVIVQDGPIPPELEEMLAELERSPDATVRREVLPRHAGLAEALNVGLRASSNDIIARMDADDISLPDRFARQLPLLLDGYDIVGSGIGEFVEDASGERSVVAYRTPPLEAEAIERYARFHVPLYHPTVVFRRPAVVAAGGYQACGYMEDYWLWARMLTSGARVANSPEPLLHYRVSSGAFARRGGWALLRSELALQRRFRSIGFTSPAQFVRNVSIRGLYRLTPEALRRRAYRRMMAGGFPGLLRGRVRAPRKD